MKSRVLIAALALCALAMGALRAADAPALKCPVSGGAAKADKTADFNGGKVQFCCENCPKAFAKDTAKFAGKANLQLVQTGQLKQKACPLSGKPCADGKVVEIAGAKIGVCCDGCLGKANKASDDEKISMLLSDTSKGFEAVKK